MSNQQDLNSYNAQQQLNSYINLLQIFDSSLNKLKQDGEANFTQVKDSLLTIISLLKQNDTILTGIANSPYAVIKRKTQISDENAQTVQYGANLAIYSVSISIQIGAPNEHLPYIGMAALLNHIGKDNNNLNSTVTTEIDKKTLSNNLSRIHIDNFDMDSLQFLSGLVNDDKTITSKTSIQEAMFQYAILISLCSSYEKLTHFSINGEIMAPAVAMKNLRDEMDSYFNKNIIKIFFNKFSIYPVGTFVKLNTKEIAKIVEVNPGFIMRPSVIIVLDQDGLEKNPFQRINLKEKPTIYIKNPITDEMLSERYLTLF